MSCHDWKCMVGRTKSGVEIALRRLHADDINLCGQWINTPELRQLLRADYPISFVEESEFINRVTAPLGKNPTDIPLGICVEGSLVGCVGLHELSARHRHATVGILIGEESMRGKGIGSAAYQLIHRFAFGELDLRAVCAHVYGHNTSSQQLHIQTGYTEVGRIPAWYYKAGEYQDLIIYHLSRESWIESRK